MLLDLVVCPYISTATKDASDRFLAWMQQASRLFSLPTITGLPPGAINSISGKS